MNGDKVGNCSVVTWIKNLKFILENMDRAYCGLKRRWTMHLVISTLFESLILRGWISAYGISSLHIWKCITNAERHILYCCFKTCTFPCIKMMLNPLQHVSQLNCWTDLPAVRTFHQLKIFGVLWAPHQKKNSRKRWHNIHFLQFQQLVSSLPGWLQAVVKGEGMLCSGKHGPVPPFWRFVAAIKFKMTKF